MLLFKIKNKISNFQFDIIVVIGGPVCYIICNKINITIKKFNSLVNLKLLQVGI